MFQIKWCSNTVQSLEKTAQLSPDFVETDVQETKDGQFIMMHDANIKNLTGVNANPQDLTLEELTKLDISENGYHSKVSSFDDSSIKANELHQKLLIEIKTSRKDSSDMMNALWTNMEPSLSRMATKCSP